MATCPPESTHHSQVGLQAKNAHWEAPPQRGPKRTPKVARELPSQKHINVVLNLFLKDHVCDQLPWEPPWACLDFLGVSWGLLRPPGCLLWQSLGTTCSHVLTPHSRRQYAITSGLQGPSMQSTRSTLAWMKNTSKSTWTWRVIRTRPRLRSAPLFMDLTCFWVKQGPA